MKDQKPKKKGQKICSEQKFVSFSSGYYLHSFGGANWMFSDTAEVGRRGHNPRVERDFSPYRLQMVARPADTRDFCGELDDGHPIKDNR